MIIILSVKNIAQVAAMPAVVSHYADCGSDFVLGVTIRDKLLTFIRRILRDRVSKFVASSIAATFFLFFVPVHQSDDATSIMSPLEARKSANAIATNWDS